MADARAVAGMDRLPWLADEPPPRTRRSAKDVAVSAVAAALLVAGASYWMGANSWQQPAPESGGRTPATTVTLPAAKPAQPAQPQVAITRAPEVEPIVAPPMPVIDVPPPVRRSTPPAQAAPRATEAPEQNESAEGAETAEKPAEPKVDPLQPWPARVIDGSSGRLVRIGTFSTSRQAKKGWWAIMRMNPALKRLPALVVPVRSLRNGRVYYRLQMGTTSQAHSEVLCQRMRMIAQSCVVIAVADRGAAAKS